MKKKSEQLNWLLNEQLKDKQELDKEKISLISEIKKIKKEDILHKKEEKLNLWQRIKKVIMG